MERFSFDNFGAMLPPDSHPVSKPRPTGKNERYQPTFLIIESERDYRQVLEQLLASEGYRVYFATSDSEGLELYKSVWPEVVLLDVSALGMSGFQVCQQLQKIKRPRGNINILFTGLEHAGSIERAFELGASDYIPKPINFELLRQRLRVLVKTLQLQSLREDLAQMVVHDMKGPIGSVSGYLELLLLEANGALNPKQRELVREAFTCTQTLAQYNSLILDMHRLEENKLRLEPTVAKVGHILEEVCETQSMMANSYQVKVKTSYYPPEVQAELDWRIIHRVLSNLLSNAIKHSNKGSQVTVSGYTRENNLLVEVRDWGEGIPVEDQPYIFDKFYQVKKRRGGSAIDSGLGLTFCKLAVEAHGGQLTFQSVPGEGSTFWVSLPLKRVQLVDSGEN